MCFKDEYWLWTQDTSSRCHAKHSNMVASATDLFFVKSWCYLILFGFSCLSFVFMENALNLGFFIYLLFAILSVKYHT